MGAAKNASSFVFIDQSEDATSKVTGAKRKAIRKQAMRDVGQARREKCGCRRTNRLQLPLFMGSVGDLNEVQLNMEFVHELEAYDLKRIQVLGVHPGKQKRAQKDLLDALWRVSPALPAQGYERLRMESGFDILSLSPLTTVHFSRAVATALANDPSRLQQLMRMPALSSFLDYIPARYSDSVLLQKAAKWAMAQAQQIFASQPAISDKKTFSLLADLLRELQLAVADEKRRFASDTLCASQLLAMLTVSCPASHNLHCNVPDYEQLLEKTEVRTWTPYAIGASKILMFKGPKAHMSDFDSAMLVSYFGFISIETLSHNQDCFLEGEDWNRVLKALSVKTPLDSERHELVIELWTYVFPQSRLFRLVTNYILRAGSDRPQDPNAAQDIIKECHELRRLHLDWRIRFSAFSLKHSLCDSPRAKARAFLALSFSSQLLCTQFIVALDPLATEAAELNDEIQDMAEMILALHEKAHMCGDWQSDILLARMITCAKAAIATKGLWAQALGGDRSFLSSQNTIGRQLFVDWNARIMREMRTHGCDVTYPAIIC